MASVASLKRPRQDWLVSLSLVMGESRWPVLRRETVVWRKMGRIIAAAPPARRMDLKIKFRAQPLPRHPRDPDRLLPDLCRGEGLLGAVVIAELLSILIVIAGSGLFPFDWLALGQVSLLALWITLLSALVLCLARRVLAGFGQIPAALLSYALILVVSALCSAVGQGLMVWWQPMGRETFSPWLVLQHLLIAAIPAGILLRYLFLQQQLRLQQRAELESRIQALQSR